ncbi:MAG: hypothetical protein C0624_00540, partial [Desulfuromonas sp.]
MSFTTPTRVMVLLAAWLISALIIGGTALADWQDDDEFADFAAEMSAEVSAFEAEQNKEVEDFLAEADRDFLEFLNDAWKDLEEFDGVPSPLKPKPKVLPKAPEPATSKPEPDTTPVVVLPKPPAAPSQAAPGKGIPSKISSAKGSSPQASPAKGVPSKTSTAKGGSSQSSPDTVAPSKGAQAKTSPVKAAPAKGTPSQAAPSQAMPAKAKPVEPEDNRMKIGLNWLGQALTFRCDPRSRHAMEGDVNPERIAEFWEYQARLNPQDILDQLDAAKQVLLLNDWGYVRLVWAFARELQPTSNEANLYSWFLLTKSGYQARLGYGDGKAYLLAAADNTIYGVPYYTVKGVRYYNLSYLDGEPRPHLMRSYDGDYAGADNGLDLR